MPVDYTSSHEQVDTKTSIAKFSTVYLISVCPSQYPVPQQANPRQGNLGSQFEDAKSFGDSPCGTWDEGVVLAGHGCVVGDQTGSMAAGTRRGRIRFWLGRVLTLVR